MDASAAKRLGLWLLSTWSTWGEGSPEIAEENGQPETEFPGNTKRGDSHIGVSCSTRHRRTKSSVNHDETEPARVVSSIVEEKQPKTH